MKPGREAAKVDKVLQASEEIGLATQTKIEDVYKARVEIVIEKYRPTLERIEAFKASGKPALARALFKSSGFLDALTKVICKAGEDAAAAIQKQRENISGVIADDDS